MVYWEWKKMFLSEKTIGLMGFPQLWQYAVQKVPSYMMDWTANMFVSSLGSWEWGLFRHLLPANLCLTITSVHLPSSDRKDEFFWELSDDGGFSTSSAYEPLIGEGWDDKFEILFGMLMARRG